MTVAERLQPLVDVAYNALVRYGRPKSQATYENIPAYQAHVAAELAAAGGDPYSAPATSPQNAMRVSMVYACVRVICGGLSQIPLHVYATQENGDRIRVAPEIDALLNRSPSPTWNSPSFWEYLATAMLLNGVGYAAIERNAAMNPIALHPLPPNSVKPKHDDVFGIVYEIRMPDSDVQEIPYANMLVLPNCGWDGLRAPSMLQTGLRNALDMHKEQERFARETWKKEALGSFAVVQEGQWTSDDIKEYIKMWNEEYGQGNNSRGKPLLFPKSSRIERLSIPLEDTQLMAAREMSEDMIRNVFGVPAIMAGHEQRHSSWGTGVQIVASLFVRWTLTPILRRVEEECTKKLVFGERYVRANTGAYERGTVGTRYNVYATGLAAGFLTVNEVRKMEDLPRLEGDEYDIPQPGGSMPNPEGVPVPPSEGGST